MIVTTLLTTTTMACALRSQEPLSHAGSVSVTRLILDPTVNMVSKIILEVGHWGVTCICVSSLYEEIEHLKCDQLSQNEHKVAISAIWNYYRFIFFIMQALMIYDMWVLLFVQQNSIFCVDFPFPLFCDTFNRLYLCIQTGDFTLILWYQVTNMPQNNRKQENLFEILIFADQQKGL